MTCAQTIVAGCAVALLVILTSAIAHIVGRVKGFAEGVASARDGMGEPELVDYGIGDLTPKLPTRMSD